MKIQGEGLSTIPVVKASGEEQKSGPSFASILDNSLRERVPSGGTNDYTKGEALS